MDDNQDHHDGNIKVEDESSSGDEELDQNQPEPGGLRQDLYVDFEEECQIFNSSRDFSVPSEQIFLLVDHKDQSITNEIKKWIKRRVIFPTVMALSFLELMGTPIILHSHYSLIWVCGICVLIASTQHQWRYQNYIQMVLMRIN